MELIIREAKYPDYKGVFQLLSQLWPDLPLDYKKLDKVFLKAVDSTQQRLIVGLIEDKIVGFCSLTIKNNLWQAGNIGHIDELIVDSEFRGKGFGKMLIGRITGTTIDNKCKRIELNSAFHEKDAHKFYESLGYENRAYLFSKNLEQNTK